MRIPAVLLLAMACGPDSGQPALPPSSSGIDADSDAFTEALDCDDNDASVNPDAEDTVGDGVDNNCDGVDGVDGDGDGAASIDSGGLDCDDTDPTTQGDDLDGDGSPACVDCDDNDNTVFPGAEEICDGLNNSCTADIDTDDEGVGVCSELILVDEPVDVLLLIDNSCSMYEEQAALANASSDIIDIFESRAIDYHIGVITTDPNLAAQSGKLQPTQGGLWIDVNTPDPLVAAAELIQAGTGGSAWEVGRDVVFTALELLNGPGGYNEGFLRADAHLEIISLSDEEDQSVNISIGDFNLWMNQLKVDGYKASFHAIVSPDPICPTAWAPGLNYLAYVQATDGLLQSICDVSYTPLINDVADLHPQVGDTRFALSNVPLISSLAVDVGLNGVVMVHYDASELTYDAATNEVTLPMGVDGHSNVTIWYAPAP